MERLGHAICTFGYVVNAINCRFVSAPVVPLKTTRTSGRLHCVVKSHPTRIPLLCLAQMRFGYLPCNATRSTSLLSFLVQKGARRGTTRAVEVSSLAVESFVATQKLNARLDDCATGDNTAFRRQASSSKTCEGRCDVSLASMRMSREYLHRMLLISTSHVALTERGPRRRRWQHHHWSSSGA